MSNSENTASSSVSHAEPSMLEPLPLEAFRNTTSNIPEKIMSDSITQTNSCEKISQKNKSLFFPSLSTSKSDLPRTSLETGHQSQKSNSTIKNTELLNYKNAESCFAIERRIRSRSCESYMERRRSKSESKTYSIRTASKCIETRNQNLTSKLTLWWTRIDTLDINEKREILRSHNFGIIAKTENPELCRVPTPLSKSAVSCLIMLFGCPQVGKSTTINSFKKAFSGEANYVEYAPVGDGISGFKTQSVQFYRLGKIQLGDSRGIVNDFEEIKEICLGQRAGRIYRANEMIPVTELKPANECIYSHIHLPVVVLPANATPEECTVTIKIIETLKMIGYEHIYMILTKVDLNKEKRKDVMSHGFAGISPNCIFPLCNLDGYSDGEDEILSILLKLLVAAELEGFAKEKKTHHFSAMKIKLHRVFLKMNHIVDLPVALTLLLCFLMTAVAWTIISRTKLSHL
jgi:hypothetical protein